jgi:hypothetical protein
LQNLSDEPGGSAQPKPSQEDLAKMGDDLQDLTIEEVDDVDAAPTEFEAEHASEPDVSTWALGDLAVNTGHQKSRELWWG